MGVMRSTHKILVGRPEWKSPLERRQSRWEDNIKMNLKEIGYEGMGWIHMT
jgi:hypothetical protein